MTSFATITPEEYKKLVDNEKKIFDLTENFSTPEILNKYRHIDKNVDDKIKQNKIIKEKYENLDKIINKSIDKFIIKPIKANKQISTEDYSDDDNIVSDKTDYDDINSKKYGQNYRFDNDDEILNFFQKYSKNMAWNMTQDKIPNFTELDTS